MTQDQMTQDQKPKYRADDIVASTIDGFLKDIPATVIRYNGIINGHHCYLVRYDKTGSRAIGYAEKNLKLIRKGPEPKPTIRRMLDDIRQEEDDDDLLDDEDDDEADLIENADLLEYGDGAEDDDETETLPPAPSPKPKRKTARKSPPKPSPEPSPKPRTSGKNQRRKSRKRSGQVMPPEEVEAFTPVNSSPPSEAGDLPADAQTPPQDQTLDEIIRRAREEARAEIERILREELGDSLF